MTENNLSDLLERAGDQTEVGVPPIEEMIAGATRLRRRRALGVALASAAAVVTAIGGTALFAASNGSVAPQPPAASQTAMMTPPRHQTRRYRRGGCCDRGTRHCGVPGQDTVVIDVVAFALCGASRPPGVESVALGQGAPPFCFEMDRSTVVDGVPAERQDTTCEASGPRTGNICAGAIYFPSLGVWFQADSSTSAAEVDRILEWVRIVPNHVAAPASR